MKIKYFRSLLVITLSGALLYGCSDGADTTGTTAAGVQSGIFTDAIVSGLAYSTPSGGSGVTNAEGKFSFNAGEKVSFSVGNVVNLGGATGKSQMSPLDLLPNHTSESALLGAMASLLQSLDSDPAPGIQLPADFSGLAAALSAQSVTTPFNFSSTTTLADIDSLLAAVKSYADAEANLTYVPPAEAITQLAAGLLDADILLTNVSKTPEAYSDKADVQPMVSPDGNTNALVMVFEDRTGENGEGEAWSAVSYDNGLSWKRINLSRSAGQEIKVQNLDFTAHNKGPSMHIEGNYALVTWISTYCPKSNPFNVDSTYTDKTPILDTEVTDPAAANADIFQVVGSQGVVSYSFGNVPYHCVWTNRGVLQDTGKLVWYKAEQLTSGRRDAKLDWPAGAENVAFGLTFQEDPEGLEPGLGEGPGLGWSGATAHHKTDIWYSHVNWANFETIATDSCVPTADVEDISCRPVAKTRLNPPVRVSDNAACKTDKSGGGDGPLYCTAETALVTDGPVYCGETVTITDVGTFCKSSYSNEDNVTVGYPLDGNTAATRPNLHFAPTEFVDGKATNAVAMVTYEETKGLCREEGEGNGCPDEPWLIGKHVIYHHFAYNQPDTIHHGYIVSQPATQEQVYDTLVDDIGVAFDWATCSALDVDEDGDTENGCYENARRERFTVNSDPENDVKVAMIFKQGAFKQGERADILMRRAVGGFKSTDFTDNVCISCGTPTVDGDGTITDMTYALENLTDGTTTNIYDDARSLRASLDGDRLLVGFAWTKDWLKATTADPNSYYKDQYNFLVRRSFDGGESWDEPRNTSNLKTAKISVVEPRIATIDKDQEAFVVTYCTADNKVRVATTDGVPTHAPGLDCFYARTKDNGVTYEVEDTDGDDIPDFLCLACGDTEQVEPVIFLTEDGNTLHSAWAQKGDLEDNGGDMQNGSDVWYRQIGITE